MNEDLKQREQKICNDNNDNENSSTHKDDI